MNEPLVCWVGLLVLGLYGTFTSRIKVQRWLVEHTSFTICGKERCFWRPLQWYNLAMLFLGALFLRSMHDIIFFDYIKYHFLDWEIYKEGCASMDAATWERVTTHHEIGLPSFLRVVSLLAPLFATGAFVINMRHSARFVADSWQYGGLEYASWVSHANTYLPLLVIGMPSVFSVMALRATIRQWAVMTCSAYAGMNSGGQSMSWAEVKDLEKATYEQDLAVAAAFQFITCGMFGFACRHALKGAINRQSADHGKLMHAAILAIHAFVIIGLVKSIIAIALAAVSTFPGLATKVGPVQVMIAAKVDPMFLFATVLCVLNMMILGSIDEVKAKMGNVNLKFNATRALLLIGQGQSMGLQSLTSGTANYDKIMNFLHKIPALSNLSWDFKVGEARLLHSSLLCFECFIIAYINTRVWKPVPLEKLEKGKENDLSETLVSNDEGGNAKGSRAV